MTYVVVVPEGNSHACTNQLMLPFCSGGGVKVLGVDYTDALITGPLINNTLFHAPVCLLHVTFILHVVHKTLPSHCSCSSATVQAPPADPMTEVNGSHVRHRSIASRLCGEPVSVSPLTLAVRNSLTRAMCSVHARQKAKSVCVCVFCVIVNITGHVVEASTTVAVGFSQHGPCFKFRKSCFVVSLLF